MSETNDILTIAQNNIRLFLSSPKINQAELSRELDINASQISKMKSDKYAFSPNFRLLYHLETKYHLSVQVLTSHIFTEEEMNTYIEAADNPSSKPQKISHELDKYVNNYYAFYFFNGEDLSSGTMLEQALDYGLISVFKSNVSFRQELTVRAIMGIRNRNLIQSYKEKFDSMTPQQIADFCNNQIDIKHRYTGKLSLALENNGYISINLYHDCDTAQIILPRPHLFSRGAYLGGLGTLNSISKRKFQPCLQCIALSSTDISSVSPEEIAQHLYMKPDNYTASGTYSLSDFIDSLYKNQSKYLNPEYIPGIVDAAIKSHIEKTIFSSQFRYFQIKEEDRSWYNLIKNYLPKERNPHGKK